MATIAGNTQIQKLPLSGGAANGRRTKVAATATAGTLIHTGPSDPTVVDEVWLDVFNSSASAVVLTVEWAGTTSPDDQIVMTIPAQTGLVLAVPGNVILGAATPLVVRAFASVANVLTIGGYVNRIQ